MDFFIHELECYVLVLVIYRKNILIYGNLYKSFKRTLVKLNQRTMKKKSEEIEELLDSGNKEQKTYKFNLYLESLESGLFEDWLMPLELYEMGVKELIKSYKTPVQAMERLEESLDAKSMNKAQKLFIVEWVYEYIKYGKIKENVEQIRELLEVHINKLSDKPKEAIKVESMQRHLKNVIKRQLEDIEQYLGELKTKDRLDYIFRILPYIMPKTKNIHVEKYENNY